MTTTSPNQTTLNTSSLAHNGSGVRTGGGIGGGGGGNDGEVAVAAARSVVIGNRANANGGSSSSNVNSLNNTHQISDAGKRKKLKSRNASVASASYSKDHLDAWLETCLKDASNAQLSSSSEFLDYNPNLTANKTVSQKQPQQQPQLSFQQQQLQNSVLTQQQHLLSSNSQPANHQTHHHQQPQTQQQQFSMRNNYPAQSTSFPPGYPAPFSLGFQKSMPNFMKSSSPFNNRYSMMYPTYTKNDGSQDFASLPPLVNIRGGSMDQEQNSADILDGSSSNPNISRGFRFSDPCLLNPSDNDSKISGQISPDRRNYLSNDMENNKLFTALMEQINLLHETNTKICRNLHENKVDIEALKHAPNWGMRQRRDSLSGLSTHSQPMAFGGGFGSQSPALTYHSGYTPGMMTDVVREVKEAARVREDALLSRVKSMVEERQWSLNEGSLRMIRDIEELKSQIQYLRADRKDSNKRITHLEAENKYMRQMLGTIFHSRTSSRDIIYENEAFRPRNKNFAPSRRSNSLNLKYGTIHNQPTQSSYSVEEQDENAFNTEETPSTTSTVDIGSANALNPRPADFANSFSTSDGGVGGVVIDSDSNGEVVVISPNSMGTVNGNSCGKTGIFSPPKFALISTPEDDHKRPRLKQPKRQDEASTTESQELRRDFSEAVAASKAAEDRIIALEKLVKNLQVSVTNSSFLPHSTSSSASLANGVGAPGSGLNAGDGNSYKMQQTAPDLTPHQHPLHHQAHTTASTSISLTHVTPKLSVAGPITDL